MGFSSHVAAAWLGQSNTFAYKHYWQVTDADIHKANARVKPNANQAAQKAAQQARATSGKEPQTVGGEVKQTAIFPGIAIRCDTMQYQLMTMRDFLCAARMFVVIEHGDRCRLEGEPTAASPFYSKTSNSSR